MATRFAGAALTNFMAPTADYTSVGTSGLEGRSLENRSSMMSEGLVANTGVQSLGKIKTAGYQADAIAAEGAAQGQQAMASGIGSMVSGIAGGFGSMGGGGGSTPSFKPQGGYNFDFATSFGSGY